MCCTVCREILLAWCLGVVNPVTTFPAPEIASVDVLEEEQLSG